MDVAGEPVTLPALLREAVERGASDLHLTRGIPPTIRLDGYLIPLDYPPLSKDSCERLCLSTLNALQKAKFLEELELDFSLDLPEAGRFRVNLHRQRGGAEGAFRVVNEVIMPLRRLGLPGVVEEIARRHMGLVLVTGPTGSGKSTTLASIVDQINNERPCMIVTIEDPIEYVHRNKRSIVKQREVSSDTRSFGAALRHVLRQDPDVIVIGEMRDMETISTALMAAETGHLVFTTLHTPDATQTVDRMIDVFPPHQQEQVRIQVANTIQAVIAQQLLPVPGNRGRVVAVEILVATTAVRKIVRSGKTEQLYTTMQTGWEQGMITMDKSLKTLYQQGLISFDDAITRCKFPMEFDNL
ncbi:MAG: type IV pilus twitching motility protein PilT [Candidatus Sumerlaeia bacterium]|nr:type IV pilus twitching motility protein PilT [Candidatus Sumerlaeia bacterium]